ncbi:MAG: polyhydroxyalkanoate depolymerase, partial [Burkholderiales bacterium]
MMYQAYQAHSDLMWPLRTLAKMSVPMLQDPTFGLAGQPSARQAAAACRVLELAEVTHKRPPWRIDSVLVKGEPVAVTEEVVHTTPFATLLRFRKDVTAQQPKVLVVAPMSGHFATLLRDTVRTVL